MFAELARNRRSVRKFQSRNLEKEKIETIIEAGLRAPSGRARRPYHLVVVTQKDLLEKLSVAKTGGGAFIKDAAACVVVCGDPQQSGLWIEDCTIAAVTMQYAAQDLGLGSCWGHMRGKDFDDSTTTKAYIAGLLNLPDHFEVECIIGLGYPDQETTPYDRDDLKYDQVSYNVFGQKS